MKLTEERKLSLVARHSRQLMREYPNVFQSKTLKQLYTPEFKYNGNFPNTTYIIDKKTNKPVLMHIFANNKNALERYTGYSFWGKKFGQEKFFVTKNIITNKSYMQEGLMKSYANERYAGTQIRMTQLKVERAMQENINYIPLYSLPEALPFHTMMGILPEKSNNFNVTSYEQLKTFIDTLKEKSDIPKQYFKPILNKENNKYFIDFNRTYANATLHYLKDYMAQTGKKMESDKLRTMDITMSLEGKNLEIWKQRALSQPILLKTNKS